MFHIYLQGETRLLLTKIPFFKEVVIMSFSCAHCGFSNNEIDYTGRIEPMGKKLTLHVNKPTVPCPAPLAPRMLTHFTDLLLQ